MAYSFNIVYRPGVLNILPDALSRLFPQKLWTDRPKLKTPMKVYGYIHMLQDKSVPRFTVAVKERKSLMAEVHSLGHIGANKMVNQIHAQDKTWPLMVKDCLEFVRKCPECQRINITRKGYHPLKAIHAHLPGEHMTVDLAGDFPLSSKKNTYLLVLTDVCTRFVILKAIPDKTAATVATTLFDIFTLIGFPQVLQSDNGREFSNQVTKIMTEQMGIHHRLVTPYHPRGNGLAENRVKAVKEILRKETKGKFHEWDRHVPMAQFSLNVNIASLHGSSPYSLFFARKANGHYNYTDNRNEVMSHEDLLKRLEFMTTIVFPAIEAKAKSNQLKMIERFNKTILHCEFPDGSTVMAVDPIKGGSLSPRYEGPFTVVRKNKGGAYILKDGTGSLLGRNYAPSQLKLVYEDPDSFLTYEVEKILDARRNLEGTWEYFTKWKNYSDDDNTWEPEDNFVERKCIVDYWADHPPHDEDPRQHSRPFPPTDSSTLHPDEQTNELKKNNSSNKKNKFTPNKRQRDLRNRLTHHSQPNNNELRRRTRSRIGKE
jgi:hypothetical protein